MDQAKWSIPRSRHTIITKNESGQRPKCKVQGVWIHGLILSLYVLDPRCPSDASTILETATRSLEDAMVICREQGVPIPNQLLIWVLRCQNKCFFYISSSEANDLVHPHLATPKADNCVRENKNGSVLRWLCYLIASGRTKVANISFSRVGHTHGALGALLSLAALKHSKMNITHQTF